jgi:hypothetical protein
MTETSIGGRWSVLQCFSGPGLQWCSVAEGLVLVDHRTELAADAGELGTKLVELEFGKITTLIRREKPVQCLLEFAVRISEFA